MITQWKDLNPTQVLALKGFGGEQGIYVRASVLRALNGDGSAAILLTQLIYWSQSDSALAHDGWFYLTTQKVTNDLGISRDIQERVRSLLVEKGILEFKKEGYPAKNWYRICLDALIELLTEQFVPLEAETPVGENAAPQLGGNSTLSMGDSRTSDVDISHTIVKTPVHTRGNKRVNIYGKSSIATSGPTTGEVPLNVLAGEKFEEAISLFVERYPINYLGVKPTRVQAKNALIRLGRLRRGYSETDYAVALQQLRAFMKAIDTYKAKVDSGNLSNQFVMGFEKFSGLGIRAGEEAPWVALSQETPVAKPRQKLVV